MATFQTVNLPLGPRDHIGEATTPTTPRATVDVMPRQHLIQPQPKEEPEATTPTRSSFAEANGKRALPISPFTPTFPAAQQSTDQDSALSRGDSHRSTQSTDSQDVDMADVAGSDNEEDGSDGESVDDESGRPSKKKKKGQRFFCTDYPPCNLSFTRSEHLARHIRYVGQGS